MVPEDGGEVEVLYMYTFEIVQHSRVQVVVTHSGRATNQETRSENACSFKFFAESLSAEAEVVVFVRFEHGFLEGRGLLLAG